MEPGNVVKKHYIQEAYPRVSNPAAQRRGWKPSSRLQKKNPVGPYFSTSPSLITCSACSRMDCETGINSMSRLFFARVLSK